MTLKSFNLDEDTLKQITAIKKAKGLKSEKHVLVRAIEHYALSEMIEHESLEYKTMEKMNAIENDLKQLKKKVNHIDHGVSVNSLFLASDFEVQRHPKAIINRDTLDSDYYTSARKEITKMIRERDSHKRIQQSKENADMVEADNNEPSESEEKKRNLDLDDDWLNV